MYVHSGIINEEIGFHTIGNSTSLSALGSIFLKDFFWEPCLMVWKLYSWSNTVGEYLHSYIKVYALINEEVDFHTKI